MSSTIETGQRYVFRHCKGPRLGDGETVTVTDERWHADSLTLYGVVRESGAEGYAFADELHSISNGVSE